MNREQALALAAACGRMLDAHPEWRLDSLPLTLPGMGEGPWHNFPPIGPPPPWRTQR